jgi:hypothetical protein
MVWLPGLSEPRASLVLPGVHNGDFELFGYIQIQWW